MHGFAKQIWPDGRTYEGEFRDGLFWGTGIMTWQHVRVCLGIRVGGIRRKQYNCAAFVN